MISQQVTAYFKPATIQHAPGTLKHIDTDRIKVCANAVLHVALLCHIHSVVSWMEYS